MRLWQPHSKWSFIMKPSEAEIGEIMRIRATLMTKVAGFVVAIGLSPFLMGGGCGFNPEDLASFAAVHNATGDQLTVVAHGNAQSITEQLADGDVIMFEVSQSADPYRFDFTQQNQSAQAELSLVSGWQDPFFMAGLITVRTGEDGTTLVVGSGSSDTPLSGISSSPLSSSISIQLIVNASQNDIGLRIPEIGFLLSPGAHSPLLVEQGETSVVDIRTLGFEGTSLSHEFSPPISANGDVSGFISFITTEPEGIQVETREARFRRLQ